MISELELANKLRVNRSVITAVRRKQLEQDKHWFKDKEHGNKVMLLSVGQEEVYRILNLKPEGQGDENATVAVHVDDKSEQSHVPTNGTEPVQSVTVPGILIINKLHMNPYIVDARADTGEEYRVMVQSSKMYQIGDPIPVIKDPRNPKIMLQVGPKPQFRGDRSYRMRIKLIYQPH